MEAFLKLGLSAYYMEYLKRVLIGRMEEEDFKGVDEAIKKIAAGHKMTAEEVKIIIQKG